MASYRRNLVPGGSYFFTVNLAERRLGLLTENIGLLRTAFRHVREAAVILQDHLHAIWILPEHDADFALRWRLIKAALSHGLPRGEALSTSRSTKGERGIWQRRYWEHKLRDQDDFTRHLPRKVMGFAFAQPILRATSECPAWYQLHRGQVIADTQG
jgi:putative transposase